MQGACALLVWGSAAAWASAAAINYGNVATPKFDFLAIAESSGTDALPLYGAPTGFDSGIDFDPTTFIASSSAGVSDLTDGQLNFTISGKPTGSGGVWGFTSLSITESGNYSLTGSGTSATAVYGGASMFVTVREIDGVAVTPFTLDVNSSLSRNLVANPGAGQPWNVVLFLDLGPSLPANAAVTKAEVVVDNSLVAISQSQSSASIAKTDFGLSIPTPVNTGEIPEPLSGALAGIATCGLLAARRRR